MPGHDVASELRWVAEAGETPTTVPRRPTRRLLALGGGLLLVGGLLGWMAARALALRHGVGAASGAVSARLSITLPAEAPLAPASSTPFNYLRPSFAVSPDGLDQYDPTPIAGTTGAFDPSFSPDGKWLGFFTFDTVLKVPLRAGAPLTIAPAVNPTGGTWCDDGTIYYSAVCGG